MAYPPGIDAVAAIVFAINMELMQMFTAPVKDELEDVMELREGGVTVNEKAPPDERTDAPHDDTELINAGQWVS